ncbi:MAG: glucosamine-6-phosphate deaminase [Oscillospiraceae bacterium]|nr:glucosamine-6-phosphate deaminase [Oscillospiraceae bacterium]
MRKIICSDYNGACLAAADIFKKQLAQKPGSVFGLATGGTPIALYQELARQSDAGEIDFSKAKAFNLDEYYPIKQSHKQSYKAYMDLHLFSKVRFAHSDIPNGEAADPAAECARYDAAIDAAGGIDLQLLGIGVNGHIGFNEPAYAYTLGTHLTKLSASTLTANSRFFAKDEPQPKKALTMGIDTIFRAKNILLLITGAAKAETAKKIFAGKLFTRNPASFLLLHPNVTVILDEAANGK